MKVGEVLGVLDEARARLRPHAGAGAAPAPAAAPKRERRRAAGRAARDADRAEGGARQNEVDLVERARQRRRRARDAARRRSSAAEPTPALRPRAGSGAAPAAPQPQGEAGAARRRRSPPARRRSHRRARAHVEAPRDDRQAPRRGAEHRGDADDLQRGRHDRGDGAARAPQAGVQGAARRRPRHRVVLRQGGDRRAARASRASTPRSRATRWCSSTTTTSASPSARAKASSCPCCATPTGCRSPRSRSGIREFAKRAEDGTLSLDDLKGGTFTITNGGVFGSLLSTPILNPPQVGILGLHKIQDRPVGRQRPGRRPADDVHRAHLRSPHRRRRRSRAVPRPRSRSSSKIPARCCSIRAARHRVGVRPLLASIRDTETWR